MKNALFAFTILMLFSCEKENEPDMMDLSLLKQFDWQAIVHNIDEGSKLPYSDTSRFSFTDNEFYYRHQYTLIGIIFGGSELHYVQTQQNSITEGFYEINPLEGTIILTYNTNVGGSPRWNVPGVETTVHAKYRIISLNQDTLKFKSISNGESLFPPLEIMQTYSSVKK